jgi:hypothetical protein
MYAEFEVFTANKASSRVVFWAVTSCRSVPHLVDGGSMDLRKGGTYRITTELNWTEHLALQLDVGLGLP